MKRDADEARDDAAVSSDEISNSEKDMKAEEPAKAAEPGEAEKAAEPEGDAEAGEPTDAEKDAEAGTSDEPDAGPEEPTAKADTPASRIAQERSRHSGVLLATLALVILALVGLLLPAWGIPLGCDLGGASVVTLTASDYEDGTTAADALAVLKNRAALLSEHDVQVTQTGDDTFELRVPAGYDASSVASALTRKGHLEFARLDSVSDADALQQLQAGASGVTLDEGTYEPFLTSDEVKGATVVSQSYYGMTYYARSVSLDSDGAAALASTTEPIRYGGSIVGAGQSYMLPALSACYLGSTMFKPGRVNIAGTFIGVLFMICVSNFMTLLSFQYYFTPLVQGLILIFAVGLSSFKTRDTIQQVKV